MDCIVWALGGHRGLVANEKLVRLKHYQLPLKKVEQCYSLSGTNGAILDRRVPKIEAILLQLEHISISQFLNLRWCQFYLHSISGLIERTLLKD